MLLYERAVSDEAFVCPLSLFDFKQGVGRLFYGIAVWRHNCWVCQRRWGSSASVLRYFFSPQMLK